jgi:hypothetical protein
VCERHANGVTIDFLKIDVEGWEEAVIRGGDWQRFRPRVVLVEATQPNSPRPSHAAWEPLLLEAGYLFAYFDGLNRYYVRKEDEDLLAHFATPPNVFDKFQPYREHLLENQLIAAYVQRDELSQLYGREREAHMLCQGQRDEYYHGREDAARRVWDLTQERDALCRERDALCRERDGLLTTVSSLREELSVLEHRVANQQARIERHVWEARALARQRDELRIERDRVVDERNHLDCRTRHLTQLLDELHASRFWRYTAGIRSVGRWMKASVKPRPSPVPAAMASTPAPVVGPGVSLKRTAKGVLRRLGGNRLFRLIERRIQNQVAPLQARDHEAAARIAYLESEVARLHQRALLTEMCIEAALRSATTIEPERSGTVPGPGAAAA